MIHAIKTVIRSITPKAVLRNYHTVLTFASAWRYGFPSRKLVIIGITGTNGKSTTCILAADLLTAAGKKVGLASSVLFRVGERQWNNTAKMTMLGRGQLQALLADMVKEGCTHAVIEVSSEGLAQGRLAGIDVDVAVFTNLTPEHIESHGGFEHYKKAKGRLFQSLSRSRRKVVNGMTIPTVIIANTDDQHAPYFLAFSADRKVGFGVNTQMDQSLDMAYVIKQPKMRARESSFFLNNHRIHTGLEGLFNIYNAAAAYTIVQELAISIAPFLDTLKDTHGLPGRMEWIDEGQHFSVLVDYAPEAASLQALYDSLEALYGGTARIIHVLGSAGGGRDVARRPILGRMAAAHAQTVIVTNEDPYDEDPDTIITQVAAGAIEGGKKEGQDLFMIQDRKKAIFKACSLAQKGDIVLLTGKGAEQAIMGPGGAKQPWDEREVVRTILRSL